VQTHHSGDFTQVEFFEVVKAEHGAFDFWHIFNGARDDAFQFRAFEQVGGLLGRIGSGEFQEAEAIFTAARDLQIRDLQTFGINQPAAIFIEGDSQLDGDLLFTWRASEALLGLGDGGLYLFPPCGVFAAEPSQVCADRRGWRRGYGARRRF
jgi:hypothetical protein